MNTLPVCGFTPMRSPDRVLVLAEIKSLARTCEAAMMALRGYLVGKSVVECLLEPVSAILSMLLVLRTALVGPCEMGKQHVANPVG